MKPDEAITKIADLIKGIPVAMLTTVTEDGHLHSRPMATQVIPLESEILFLTGEHSGKVRVDDPEVRVLHIQIEAAECWETAPNSPIRSEKLLP